MQHGRIHDVLGSISPQERDDVLDGRPATLQRQFDRPVRGVRRQGILAHGITIASTADACANTPAGPRELVN